MQMQREAQHHDWSKTQGGFDQFFKGLQKTTGNNSGGGGAGGGSGSGSGASTQGSPLKYEMGGGGEMLPMMGDRFS
jgi:membrane protein involved in colicin uptake